MAGAYSYIGDRFALGTPLAPLFTFGWAAANEPSAGASGVCYPRDAMIGGDVLAENVY
jgi:hypothetical protein